MKPARDAPRSGAVAVSTSKALLARLLLGRPRRGNLGVGEDGRRERPVVSRLAFGRKHVTNREPALVVRDRRELRDAGDVPGGPDPAHGRLAVGVDRQRGSLVPQARRFEVEPVDIRTAADRVQHLIRDESALAAAERERDLDELVASLEPLQLGAGEDLDPFRLERVV